MRISSACGPNRINAARGMAYVEELTDADIAEVKASAEAFEGVEQMTAGLRRFLDFYHARRWADAVSELWTHADPELATRVARVRALAARTR